MTREMHKIISRLSAAALIATGICASLNPNEQKPLARFDLNNQNTGFRAVLGWDYGSVEPSLIIDYNYWSLLSVAPQVFFVYGPTYRDVKRPLISVGIEQDGSPRFIAY